MNGWKINFPFGLRPIVRDDLFVLAKVSVEHIKIKKIKHLHHLCSPCYQSINKFGIIITTVECIDRTHDRTRIKADFHQLLPCFVKTSMDWWDLRSGGVCLPLNPPFGYQISAPKSLCFFRVFLRGTNPSHQTGGFRYIHLKAPHNPFTFKWIEMDQLVAHQLWWKKRFTVREHHPKKLLFPDGCCWKLYDCRNIILGYMKKSILSRLS